MIEISDLSGLESMIAASNDTPVLLLKHSTACPVSASVYRRVVDYLQAEGAAAPPCYLVKVIEARPVSNAAAERFGVKHQSPQLLLVHAGKSVWDASHGAIEASAIRGAVARLA
jgi:bacillithiol system protein YtxJ